MAFERDDFQRTGAGLSGNSPAVFSYGTADANGTGAGQTGQAGYFNGARAELSVGDVIACVNTITTTPTARHYVVTAVPAAPANVTVVAFATTA